MMAASFLHQIWKLTFDYIKLLRILTIIFRMFLRPIGIIF